MEYLLCDELRLLGAVSPVKGRSGVSFRGPLAMGYQACLGSRIANRILLPLKKFAAPDPDRLYSGVRSIHWTDHMSEKATLAVDFSTSHSGITHSHFGALKVKDAIVDQFRAVRGTRPSVRTVRPDLQVNVYLFQDEATVSIDLSGESLHRRGYRTEGSAAPLKENLAAALLIQSGWSTAAGISERGSEFGFLDPMCGSGSLPIEAALIAGGIAPGLGRRYFGFLGWLGHNPSVWSQVVNAAQEAIVYPQGPLRGGLRKKYPKILGFDRDERAIRIALSHLEEIGVDSRSLLRGRVHFEKRDLSLCDAPSAAGILIVNPPYGERLGDIQALRPLYRDLGDLFKQKFKGWSASVFTGSPELSKEIGLKAAQRSVFFNGPIECRLLRYEIY
jgi:23S rRNA (guanine2445-N2)-methyltransferase / 23S rRNA (guanine2069-N7)-methyltransferase